MAAPYLTGDYIRSDNSGHIDEEKAQNFLDAINANDKIHTLLSWGRMMKHKVYGDNTEKNTKMVNLTPEMIDTMLQYKTEYPQKKDFIPMDVDLALTTRTFCPNCQLSEKLLEKIGGSEMPGDGRSLHAQYIVKRAAKVMKMISEQANEVVRKYLSSENIKARTESALQQAIEESWRENKHSSGFKIKAELSTKYGNFIDITIWVHTDEQETLNVPTQVIKKAYVIQLELKVYRTADEPKKGSVEFTAVCEQIASYVSQNVDAEIIIPVAFMLIYTVNRDVTKRPHDDTIELTGKQCHTFWFTTVKKLYQHYIMEGPDQTKWCGSQKKLIDRDSYDSSDSADIPLKATDVHASSDSNHAAKSSHGVAVVTLPVDTNSKGGRARAKGGELPSVSEDDGWTRVQTRSNDTTTKTNTPSKRKSDAPKKNTAEKRSKQPVGTLQESEDEEDDMVVPHTPSKRKSDAPKKNTAEKRSKQPVGTLQESEDEEDDMVVPHTPLKRKPAAPKKSTTEKRSKQPVGTLQESEDEEDDMVVPHTPLKRKPAAPKKSTTEKRSKQPVGTLPGSDEEEDDMVVTGTWRAPTQIQRPNDDNVQVNPDLVEKTEPNYDPSKYLQGGNIQDRPEYHFLDPESLRGIFVNNQMIQYVPGKDWKLETSDFEKLQTLNDLQHVITQTVSAATAITQLVYRWVAIQYRRKDIDGIRGRCFYKKAWILGRIVEVNPFPTYLNLVVEHPGHKPGHGGRVVVGIELSGLNAANIKIQEANNGVFNVGIFENPERKRNKPNDGKWDWEFDADMYIFNSHGMSYTDIHHLSALKVRNSEIIQQYKELIDINNETLDNINEKNDLDEDSSNVKKMKETLSDAATKFETETVKLQANLNDIKMQLDDQIQEKARLESALSSVNADTENNNKQRLEIENKMQFIQGILDATQLELSTKPYYGGHYLVLLDTYNTLKKEKDIMEEGLQRMEISAKSYTDENNRLQEELRDNVKDNVGLANSLSLAETSLDEFSKYMNAIGDAYDKKMSEFVHDTDKIKQELIENNKTRDTVEKQLACVQDELAQSRKETRDIKTQQIDAASTHTENIELHQKLKNNMVEMNQMVETSTELTTQLRSLGVEHDQLVDAQVELKRAQDHVETTLRGELHTLQHQCHELKSGSDNLEKMLRDEKQDVELNRTNFTTEIALLKEKLVQCMTNLENEKQDVKQVKGLLAKEKSINRKYINELNQQYEEIQHNKNEHESEHQNMLKRLREKECRIDELKQRCKTLSGKVSGGRGYGKRPEDTHDPTYQDEHDEAETGWCSVEGGSASTPIAHTPARERNPAGTSLRPWQTSPKPRTPATMALQDERGEAETDTGRTMFDIFDTEDGSASTRIAPTPARERNAKGTSLRPFQARPAPGTDSSIQDTLTNKIMQDVTSTFMV
jgi:hypothetical protein